MSIILSRLVSSLDEVELPYRSRVLNVEVHDEVVYINALCNISKLYSTRKVTFLAVGIEVDPNSMLRQKFINTVILKGTKYFVFVEEL